MPKIYIGRRKLERLLRKLKIDFNLDNEELEKVKADVLRKLKIKIKIMQEQKWEAKNNLPKIIKCLEKEWNDGFRSGFILASIIGFLGLLAFISL